jgi:hypothetical protein
MDDFIGISRLRRLRTYRSIAATGFGISFVVCLVWVLVLVKIVRAPVDPATVGPGKLFEDASGATGFAAIGYLVMSSWIFLIAFLMLLVSAFWGLWAHIRIRRIFELTEWLATRPRREEQ